MYFSLYNRGILTEDIAFHTPIYLNTLAAFDIPLYTTVNCQVIIRTDITCYFCMFSNQRSTFLRLYRLLRIFVFFHFSHILLLGF